MYLVIDYKLGKSFRFLPSQLFCTERKVIKSWHAKFRQQKRLCHTSCEIPTIDLPKFVCWKEQQLMVCYEPIELAKFQGNWSWWHKCDIFFIKLASLCVLLKFFSKKANHYNSDIGLYQSFTVISHYQYAVSHPHSHFFQGGIQLCDPR